MGAINLIAGANHRVPQQPLQLDVHLYPPQLANVEVDISAFLLDVQGKVRGDADMVFYGQTRSGNGSVQLQESRAGYAKFSVDLTQIESAITKIAFSATIHENRKTFASFQRIELHLRNQQQHLILSANLPTTGMIESALILGEYYLRQQQWKFRAIGQGFAGGLKPLAEHFGVDIADTPAPSSTTPPSASKPLPASPPTIPSTSKKPVSLSKITLDKRRSVVNLDKKPT
ncbi:MAG TPA: tellurium resistance protein TerA, partial [Thiothrix sp.]|nr:tellurium resistance protein TerA [Thiothrix sp.]